ncbi:hypothetical protein BKA58DRAFT_240922 [Alternaria rosae]|uniref:uncharacterized protein n=1 Tax=Alternaria rosae TaxID=1187941 RepID=UPI001E8E42F4|nr:uncharacterized protein BKA58DRAFT_240922 [Alternaria rosae]KAH6865204.1 hypothetical protein BKA58DRAFT_240922 [Alternaria rosae]
MSTPSVLDPQATQARSATEGGTSLPAQVEAHKAREEGVIENRPYVQGTKHPSTGDGTYPSIFSTLGLFVSDSSPTRQDPGSLQQCSSCATRKGILKKVRFLEEPRIPSSPTQSAGSSLRNATSAFPSRSPLYPPVLPLPAPPPPPPPIQAPRPPTLFNKTIETNELLSVPALRLYTNFMDELYNFVARQAEVVVTRLAVQERRMELHRLREHVSRCDMILFDRMREQRNGNLPFNEDAMVNLFEASQAARDEIGPVESEYEPLEIMLGSKEQHLVDMYSKLEKTFGHFFRLDTTPSTKPTEPSEIEYESSSIASLAEEFTSFHDIEHLHGAIVGETVNIAQLPRLAGLDSKLPELVIAHRETSLIELAGLHTARNVRSAEEYSKLDLGDTLNYIGKWITDSLNELEIGTRFQKDVTDQLASDESNYINIPGALQDSMTELPVNRGLEEGNPLLLHDESIETRRILSEYLMEFDSTPDRVNRWMLHQLRISPHETYALYRCSAVSTEQPLHWATSVLKMWPHDNFGQVDPYGQGSVELEESVNDPQRLGYHGACLPGCRSLDAWPANDMWLESESSFDSRTEAAQN